jgi:ATPase family associated with various cellular activities (AAA)
MEKAVYSLLLRFPSKEESKPVANLAPRMTTEPDYCFQPEAETQLYEWMFKRTTPAFLLVGPPGIGKTTVVHRVMKKIGYTLCEFNASHTRSGIAFRKTILPLLKHGGVQEWLRDGKPDRMAVLLDEMDGLSGGEKGGLQELLGFLREWKQGDSSHPLVLICNTLHGRPMEQIRRICTTLVLQPPNPDVILETLHKPGSLPRSVAECGDLRVIFRHLSGFPALDQVVHVEDSNCTSASLEWAWQCLFGEYDPYMNIALENNEANLAGLVLHENSPVRLKESPKNLEEYKRIFKILYDSDWADFWAFFYQCWQILPLTQQLKLKVTNQIFANHAHPGTVPPAKDLVFTRVLSRQSALFNAWCEMCRIHDTAHVPIRCVAMVAGTFPDQKTRNLALQ